MQSIVVMLMCKLGGRRVVGDSVQAGAKSRRTNDQIADMSVLEGPIAVTIRQLTKPTTMKYVVSEARIAYTA